MERYELHIVQTTKVVTKCITGRDFKQAEFFIKQLTFRTPYVDESIMDCLGRMEQRDDEVIEFSEWYIEEKLNGRVIINDRNFQFLGVLCCVLKKGSCIISELSLNIRFAFRTDFFKIFEGNSTVEKLKIRDTYYSLPVSFFPMLEKNRSIQEVIIDDRQFTQVTHQATFLVCLARVLEENDVLQSFVFESGAYKEQIDALFKNRVIGGKRAKGGGCASDN